MSFFCGIVFWMYYSTQGTERTFYSKWLHYYWNPRDWWLSSITPALCCCRGPEFLLSITAEQDFNAICLSSYRTACKLRFIQKRCNCKSYQNKLFQTNLNIDATISPMFSSQTSAFDRHIQRDWGCAGHWSECGGAERWHISDQTGEPSVLNVQPAQQAPAYHSHHQPERKRSPAGGLLTGCCWVVTKEKCTLKSICCKSSSLIFVNMILSVSQITVWQCSQWRPCYPCCVEANLWINCAVSTCSCRYTQENFCSC